MTLALFSTALARPASQRTIWPQNCRKGDSWSMARGPCCHLRVVSPVKTAVRPLPTGCTASTGMSPASVECGGQDRGAGPRPADLRAAVQARQPVDLGRAGFGGEEADDVGEDRVHGSFGRERGQEGIGHLADVRGLPSDRTGRILPMGVPS